MMAVIQVNGDYFNPRSPQGGATMELVKQVIKMIFQSTLPARGSDPSNIIKWDFIYHFNPRSPQGGATSGHCNSAGELMAFQSTLPARGSDTRTR